MKLYLIDYYENNKSFPKIDKVLITNIMKILCQEKGGCGRPPKKETKNLKNELLLFFNEHYKLIMKDNDLSYKHMNTILDYLGIDILTIYETNIKQHYIEYIERYVNVELEKDKVIEEIKFTYKSNERKKEVEKFCRELRKIKEDLLNIETDKLKSNEKYHQWIKDNKYNIIPKKTFEKNSIYYDLQCYPQDYLPFMYFMMKEVENKDKTIFNLFPLRNNIVPKHIRLDTTSLVHILIEKNYGNKGFYLTKGNLIKHQDRLWNFFFRTEKKCFHNKESLPYRFNYMIETDGVSCCILLVRKDMFGKRFKPQKSKNKKELYIDDLDDWSHLKNKKQICIDPNMSDLLYCSEENTKKQFRYTQDQRRKETKVKKYRKR